MIKGLHHIAIAANDPEGGIELIERLFSLPLVGVEDVEAQGTKVALFGTGATLLELISPLRDDSPVARFLKKRGEGLHLHHLCFLVEDIEKARDELMERGARFTTGDIQEGTGGTRTLFIHPSCTCGILIEIKEGKKG